MPAAVMVVLAMLFSLTVTSPAVAATVDINDVGSIAITKIADGAGREYNGTRADGSKVTDGVVASKSGAPVAVSLAGRIDMSKLTAGDMIDVPYSLSGSFANRTNTLFGPTALTDAAGATVFDVVWNPSSGVLLRLTRTKTESTGNYSFTLDSGLATFWRSSLDTEDLRRLTSTTITVADSTASFENTPYTDDDMRITPCNLTPNAALYQNGRNDAKASLVATMNGCTDLNRMLRGEDPNAITDDMIAWTRITPTAGSIAGITYATTRTRWNNAYDETTIGSNSQDLGNNLTWFSSLFTQTDADVTSIDTARATLKPGQLSAHDNGDGSWTVAVNMGPRQGADAITPPAKWTVGDATTNRQIQKARDAHMTPQGIETFLDVTVTDRSKPFTAVAESSILFDGQRKNGTINLRNSLGSAAGQGQSTIRLDPNGGNGSATQFYGDPGHTLKASNTFTRDGYSFTGWNSKADGTGTAIPDGGDATYPKEGAILTLYAQWRADKATITYDANAKDATGTTDSTDGVTDGVVKAAANGFTRKGYTFQGWNSKADGSGDDIQPGTDVTLPAGGMTLFAQWKAAASAVRYHGNGGNGTMGDTNGVNGGHVKAAANAFTRDGYTFASWNTKADGSGTTVAPNADVTLDADGVDLYAQWAADKASITYQPGADDATGTTAPTVGVTDGVVKTAANGFTRDGYTFAGWRDESGAILTPGADVTLPAGGVTLTAVWSANPASVHYDGNGATGGATPDTPGTTGATVKASDNGYTRDGYTFAGWTDPSGRPVKPGDTVTLPAGGLVLKAAWRANTYTIRFDHTDGTGTMADQSAAFGSDVKLAANAFTRDGYSFTGWATSKGGKVAYTDGSTVRDLTAVDKDTVTLYAVWTADGASVRFDANGGDGTMTPVDSTTGATVAIPANAFTRKGWTFAGWNTAADGSGTKVADKASVTVPAKGLTLYAQWIADKATLSYDANAKDATGTTDATDGVTDQIVKAAANGFTRTGYSFVAWNSKPDGSGTSVAPGADVTLPAGGMTLYAVWRADGANITFDANGGTGTMKDIASTTNATVTLPANTFTRPGWTFAGWNTAADGSGDTVADKASVTVPARGLTLYAQWTADKATLSYDANAKDATGATAPVDGVTDGRVKAADNGFARDGYAFVAWNSKPDGTGTAVAPGADVTLPAGGLTLYAQWRANPAVVSFDPNGGMGAMTPIVSVTGADVPLPANAFTRDGYTFAGWNTARDGSGASTPDKGTVVAPAGGVTLYAQWTPAKATLTYDGNGGEGSMTPVDSTTDAKIKAAANGFTRAGYTFAGWTTAADGSGPIIRPGDEITMPAHGLTLYAGWTADKASITYTPNGGTGSMRPTEGVTDGRVTVADNAFTRDGYAFAGWRAKDGTPYAAGQSIILPAGGLELAAQWTALSAPVTYRPNGGEGSMQPTDGVTDQTVTIADNGFTRNGYTFTGWKAADGRTFRPGDKATLPAGGLTLDAQWTADKATITYDANAKDANGETQPTDGVTDGVVKAADNGFVRSGWTFVAWNTKADGTGTSVSPGSDVTLPAGGLTLYAVWRADKATIVYDANGGEGETDPTDATTGASVKAADNGFTRRGYTFAGWNTKSDGSGDKIDDKTTVTVPAKGLTLYAQWKAGKASVTFNPNGDGSTGTTTTIEGTTDGTFTAPDNGFTRPGYTFTGWNTAKDGSGTAINPGDTVTIPAGGMTLHAQWKAEGANVSFNANQGQGAMDDIQSTTGTKVTLPANAFTRDGWTFTGWNTKPDGTGQPYEPNAKLTLPAGGVTLYAQWTMIPPKPADPTTSKLIQTSVTAPVREVAHLAQTGMAFPLLLLGLLPAGATGMMLSSRRNGRPHHRR